MKRGRCKICGRPTRLKPNGERAVTCPDPKCQSMVRHHQHAGPRWPKWSAPREVDFSRYNVTPRDDYGSVPLPPPTLVSRESNT